MAIWLPATGKGLDSRELWVRLGEKSWVRWFIFCLHIFLPSREVRGCLVWLSLGRVAVRSGCGGKMLVGEEMEGGVWGD
jgi:hypothetical protein